MRISWPVLILKKKKINALLNNFIDNTEFIIKKKKKLNFWNSTIIRVKIKFITKYYLKHSSVRTILN